MPADSPLDSVKKTLIDADVLSRECDAVEDELRALKVAWEQFFLGLERKPPTKQYEEFKKRMLRLKNQFTRSTPVKFRINSVHQKFVSYERLWQRTQQQMEDGTYRRDLFKAKLHAKERKAEPKKDHKKDDFDIEEDLGDMGLDDELSAPPPPPATRPAVPPPPAAKPLLPGVAPAVAAKPATPPAPAVAAVAPPVAAAKAPAPAGTIPRAAAPTQATKSPPPSGESLSDAKVKAIYDAYVTAKRRCQEDTSKITLESVATTLRKQVPELMKQHNAKGVDFKVVIKDGKALLRAVPKE